MSDLSDFGGGIEKESYNREHYEDDEDDNHESSNPKYRTGRCRALAKDGTRCSGSVAGRNISDDDPDLCHMHDTQKIVRTIDDDPVTLIEGTSRTLFERLDERAVDEQLIREAVHRIHGLEDMPITVTDGGVILPYRYAQAPKKVIRTPTATVQVTSRGDETAVESLMCSVVKSESWDEERTQEIRNEKCLPSDRNSGHYSIGLKIFGNEQEWYTVEFASGDLNEPETTSTGGG